jgi:hypothetical protein
MQLKILIYRTHTLGPNWCAASQNGAQHQDQLVLNNLNR